MSTQHIGLVLQVHEIDFSKRVNFWETQLVPKINKLIESYSTLELGTITSTAFVDLMENNGEVVRKRYFGAVDEDLKRFKTKPAKQAAVEAANAEFNKVLLLATLVRDALLNQDNSSIAIAAADIEVSDIQFADGRPYLDKEVFHQKFVSTIDTQLEADLYEHMLSLQKVWRSLREFVNESGYDTEQLDFFGSRGFFYVDHHDDLVLNEGAVKDFSVAITYLKGLNMKQRARYASS